MERGNWKNVERNLAKRLSGKRVPITGRTRGSTPDIEHPNLSIEVKSRKEIPLWLKDAMDQTEKANPHNDKIPIVILHELGKRHDNDYVIISLKNFLLLGDSNGFERQCHDTIEESISSE